MRLNQTHENSKWDFQDLMLHRVLEILLVGSPYDAYILEEDGRLTEQILNEYLGMKLRYAPRIWHTPFAGEALNMISKQRFDIVLVMLRIYDMDPITLGNRLKEKYPRKPVVLLLFDESEFKQLPENLPKTTIDNIFIYSGNADLFPAIMKLVEDKQNVKRDVRRADIRTIIVIEDNPRYYSIMLPLIYKEILYHTNKLIDKSLNTAHWLLHKRGRPKILLAQNYEEGKKYFKKYQANVLGIISDIRFRKKGVLTDDAGIQFARWVRKKERYMPIMLQSTDENNKKLADTVNTHFLHKNSPLLIQTLRKFIINNFGFGDFIFRLENGQEIARAHDLMNFQKLLRSNQVPDDSIEFHSKNNHFSNWFAARGEFRAATSIRPKNLEDFFSISDLRKYLIDLISETLENQQLGQIIEFKDVSFNPQAVFVRLVSGSLGGKARGLAFAYRMIIKSKIKDKFPDVRIRIPKVAVIGADEFEYFMDKNNLWHNALTLTDNDEIIALFLKSKLSDKLSKTLKVYLKEVRYPLAIRSSSFLEDAQYNPTAGMFATFMLHNSAADEQDRLTDIIEAIKRIFASLFFRSSKAAINSSAHILEEEKMAIIIQELIGQQYEDRFYPTVSGVAKSYNYYPVSYMKRDEGIAYIALGLGRTVAEGEKSLRFSPKYPALLPQFYSIKSTIENSQNQFYALKMDPTRNQLAQGESGNLEKYDLATAEKDGVLKWLASVVCSEDNMIRDSLQYDGLRVLTLAPLLKFNFFPLADIIREMLELGKKSLGCPVEIEFAFNIFKDTAKKPEFCLLQIKPLPINLFDQSVNLEKIPDEEKICQSSLALGNGKIDNIKDIIYVKHENFDVTKTRKIAAEIGKFNDRLGEDHPYFLIGPGRWGSADPLLGIPVEWNQICHAKMIAELGMEGFNIDPSFGSHFFQNVTSMKIGYFTINYKKKQDLIDWEWLNEQHTVTETQYLKWIKVKYPITVRIDGRIGFGAAFKPKKPEMEKMDEEESSGI